MALIALCSAKGSPGATTTALALAYAWPVGSGHRVLVIDADTAGGDVASGFLRGTVGPEVGFVALASDRSRPFEEAVIAESVALDDSGRRLVLPGLSNPAHAPRLAGVWQPLIGFAAAKRDVDVLVDIGRLGSVGDTTGLLRAADVVLLVLRSSLPSVTAGRSAVRRLVQERAARPGSDGGVQAVVVGERRPYSASDVAGALDLPGVAAIAWDPVHAAVLSDGAQMSRRFVRSALMRSASVLATNLHAFDPAESGAFIGSFAGPSVISSVATVRASSAVDRAEVPS